MRVTFSAVRFHTVTTWPIFNRLETIPLPISPRPRNPILEAKYTKGQLIKRQTSQKEITFSLYMPEKEHNNSISGSNPGVHTFWSAFQAKSVSPCGNAAVRVCLYLLSVGVMLPLMAVLSAAWIDVDPVSCTNKQNIVSFTLTRNFVQLFSSNGFWRTKHRPTFWERIGKDGRKSKVAPRLICGYHIKANCFSLFAVTC